MPRQRAWMFSSVVSGGRPANTSLQRAERRFEHRLDRDHVVAHAERCAPARAASSMAHLRRVARRHHHGVHAIGAERVDGDRERERRIDAARQAEHDAGEAVLARRSRARRARARCRRSPPSDGCRLDAPAAARACRRTQIELDDVEIFLERRRALHDFARRVDHERAAVEHELVLPADHVHVDERQPRSLARARASTARDAR